MKANSLSSAKNLQDLITKAIAGLKKLTFTDNFEAFKAQDIEIAPGQTVSIRNELTFIPSQYIITSQEGNGLVTKAKLEIVNTPGGTNNTTQEWNLDYLYLKNNGSETNEESETVKITVIFMR